VELSIVSFFLWNLSLMCSFTYVWWNVQITLTTTTTTIIYDNFTSCYMTPAGLVTCLFFYLVARDVGSMCQMRTPDWHATASTDAELGLYENEQHNIVNVLWLKKLSAVIENFYQADSCFNHNSIFFRRNLTKFSITCARHFYKILCFLYRAWFKFLLVLILYQFKVDFIFVNCLTMREVFSTRFFVKKQQQKHQVYREKLSCNA